MKGVLKFQDFRKKCRLLELLFFCKTSNRSTFCTELHFSGKLLFLILRFVPYLSKHLESNRISKNIFVMVTVTYTGFFCQGKTKIFGKLEIPSNFCIIYISYGPMGRTKGLRSHIWWARSLVELIIFNILYRKPYKNLPLPKKLDFLPNFFSC